MKTAAPPESGYRPAAWAALAAVCLAACMGTDNGTNPPVVLPPADTAGTLEVTVKRGTAERVPGAWVQVEGASRRVSVADRFGQAVFFDLPPGEYGVSALSAAGYGEVRTQVILRDIARSELRLLEVDPPGPAFSANLESGFTSSPGDTIRLRIVLADPSRAAGATWEIESDLGGKLASGSFGDSATTLARIAPMAKGRHSARIRVTAGGGISHRVLDLSVTAPARVRIASLSRHGAGVRVVWSRYPDPDFSRYEIHAAASLEDLPNSRPIAILADRERLQWDDSLPPLHAKLFYQVRTLLRDSSRSEGRPDSIAQEMPGFPSLFDAVLHPTQPVAYVIGMKSELTRIGYLDGARSEAAGSGEPGFLTLADAGAGLELHVPSRDGEIAVLDPATLARRAALICGAPVNSVALFGSGRLLASVYEFNGIRLITRNPVAMVSKSHFANLRLLSSSRGAFAVGATINQSPGGLHLFRTLPPADFLEIKTTEIQADYSDGYKAMALSPDDSLLIHSGAGALYRPDPIRSGTFAYLGSLPVDSEAYTDFAFTPGSDSVYCAIGNARKVRLITLADRTVRREWRLRGLPERLFLRGRNLVCFSRVASGRPEHALEILDRSAP